MNDIPSISNNGFYCESVMSRVIGSSCHMCLILQFGNSGGPLINLVGHKSF